MSSQHKAGRKFRPSALTIELVRRTIGVARERAGAGWQLLGRELQEALVAREAVRLLNMQLSLEYGPAKDLVRDIMVGFDEGVAQGSDR